jgi:energy-coupling factor transport system substrate-specific component
MSWQLSVIGMLALVLVAGGVWFERSRPSARILAAVAALAALGVAGRVLLAPLPNVVGTTDVALLAGYALGGPAGFAVGALSALISNFWLGQGPWTPWQMAGWGAVGVGGAALATVSGRSLGRVGLAAAAAVAGLLYGALLDLSTMVNFGGEQSLDRYLALSARGIPFNIAHAAGNAAIMLAAGPALVRMLDRYQARFAITWEQAPGAGAAAGLALLASAAAIAAGPGTSSAPAAPVPAEAAGAGNASAWLLRSQNRDGGFGVAPGAASGPAMTGWAMLGMEAAGINPRDVRRAGRSPVAYLRARVADLSSTGDLERTILALRGAGVSARSFGGRDLVAELRSRRQAGGSYERQVNLTAFALLARSAVGEPASSLRGSARWLRQTQNRDGGWGSVKRAPSEPDSTGAVLQALAVVDARGPLSRGAAWLRGAQRADGGWSLTRGAGSNSQSTAWALQGLVAAGVNPSGVRKGARNGFDYLGARQARDGRFAYSKGGEQTPVWVTAQAITGIRRATYPIAPVKRSSGAKPGSGAAAGSSGGSGDGSGSADSSSASGDLRSALGRGSGGAGGGRRAPGNGGGGRTAKAAAGGGGASDGGGRIGEGRRAPSGAGEPVAAAEEAAPSDDDVASPVLLGFGLANLIGAAALGGWIGRQNGRV